MFGLRDQVEVSVRAFMLLLFEVQSINCPAYVFGFQAFLDQEPSSEKRNVRSTPVEIYGLRRRLFCEGWLIR